MSVQVFYCLQASSSSRQAKATSSGLCQQIAEDKYQDCSTDAADNTVLYNFTTEDIEKKENISFSAPQYTNKVLLVVNLASFWGYTPQYYSLNALSEKYADQPFKILGFPCNQFLRQEPGANASEIFAVLKHVRPGALTNQRSVRVYIEQSEISTRLYWPITDQYTFILTNHS